MIFPEQCFCTKCRKEVLYTKKVIKEKHVIRDKEYVFDVTNIFCNICNEPLYVHGLIDLNNEEIDSQYRASEGIVTIADIEKIMKMYDIGKTPLSLVLGFGEVTVGRYFMGQVPSVEYSNIMRGVLTSYDKMATLLEENKFKISPAAYKKVYMAICDMKQMFNLVSKDTLNILSYIFKQITDLTPLAMQKLLYFAQGIYYSKYSKPLFNEKCEAWVHGPVYPNIYQLFKDFKYNPIDDERFTLIAGIDGNLDEDKKEIIDLVLSVFGMYSGKTLENLTHCEGPWVDARQGMNDNVASSNPITLEKMKEYFSLQNNKYDMYSEKGLQKFIYDKLDQ